LDLRFQFAGKDLDGDATDVVARQLGESDEVDVGVMGHALKVLQLVLGEAGHDERIPVGREARVNLLPVEEELLDDRVL